MPFDSFDELPVEARIIDEALKQFRDGEGWPNARKIAGKHRCMRGYLCLARKALNNTPSFSPATKRGQKSIACVKCSS